MIHFASLRDITVAIVAYPFLSLAAVIGRAQETDPECGCPERDYFELGRHLPGCEAS